MTTIDKRYKYTPDLPDAFKCRVPLDGSMQVLVTNGILQKESIFGELSLVPKKEYGFDLLVKKNAVIKNTLQIIGIRDREQKSSTPTKLSVNNHFKFEENSESELLLCSHTLSLDNFVTESNLFFDLDRGATAHIVVMQNEHDLSTHKLNFIINQAESTSFKMVVVGLNGASVENNIVAELNQEGATCNLNGISLVDGRQEFKTSISLHHRAPHCMSSQLFKSILDDYSRVWFTGKITVFKNAQKTEAYQANHNLLLSDNAKSYTQPQLEIYADDVKCSHGATSGRLDEDAVFYMRSRGIGIKEARLLQQIAFVYSVLEKIDNEQLRHRLQELVERRLRGEFSSCENCSAHCC